MKIKLKENAFLFIGYFFKSFFAFLGLKLSRRYKGHLAKKKRIFQVRKYTLKIPSLKKNTTKYKGKNVDFFT